MSIQIRRKIGLKRYLTTKRYSAKVTDGDLTMYAYAFTYNRICKLAAMMENVLQQLNHRRYLRVKNMIVNKIPLEKRWAHMKGFDKIRRNFENFYINSERNIAHFLCE